MIQARPQTLSNALFEEVQLYVDHPEQITEFGLRKLERETDKLALVDAANASTIKAAIAAFRWDTEEVDYWTKNALKLNKSFLVLANSAINKGLVGDYSEAADLILQSTSLAKNDPDAILGSCHGLMFDARFEEIIELSKKFVDYSEEFKSIHQECEVAINALNFLGIRRDEVRHRIKNGAQVAKDLNTRIRSIDTRVISDYEGDLSFIIALEFYGDIHKEIALDEALVEKFLDDKDWDPTKLSVEFRYITHDELHTN